MHRKWVESQLKTRQARQDHFGRSLAVGSEVFIRSVQQALDTHAVGRRVFKTAATGYQLKESIAGYGSIDSDRAEEENSAMPDKTAILWKWDDRLE